MISWFRYALTKIGAHVSTTTIHRLNAIVNYLETGRWMRAHGFDRVARFPTRYALFDSVAKLLTGQRVLYLEFGVHRGDSIRHWSELLSHSESHLVGFDSFEGLPEDWCENNKAGRFF